ncbi:MAG: hypothetical protein JNN00_01175 [Chitinophagaceae bacterium]|nr:hypothetical protein [Chitinophagaceae bacterium]
MRSLFILFLVMPAIAGAQINRSAKELAGEKIQEYITGKLFKNKEYRSISFDDIKEVGDRKKDEIVWTIAHKFEITEGGKSSFENSPKNRKKYSFIFYLDDKMKVLKADTWYSQ